MAKLNPDTQLLDIAAAAAHVAGTGKGTGVIGFCYGGLLTWLSATRAKALKMDLKAAVGFYAGGIGKFASEAALLSRCNCTLAPTMTTSARTRSTPSALRIPTSKSFSTRAQGTLSPTKRVPVMCPPPPSWPMNARWQFLKSHIAK